MKEIRKVGFCPHCSNRAPQKFIYEAQHYESITFDEKDPKGSTQDIPASYFVVICETCNQVLIYYEMGDVPKPENFDYATLIWPETGFRCKSLPDKVKKCYEEALRVKNISPSSFAVQIRRGLEAICDDRGIPKKGNLQSRLVELSKKDDIPKLVSEVSDLLRVIGNAGAHGDGVSADYVWSIDQLFRVIIEYVYVAPEKLQEFKKSLATMTDTET